MPIKTDSLEDISNIYEIAANSGHPDPLGFVARLNVISGLDQNHSGEGIGIAGLRAPSDEYDINTIEGNIFAAIAADAQAFNVDADIQRMHAIAALGREEATKEKSTKRTRFLTKLEKSRKEMAFRLGIGDVGENSEIEQESSQLAAKVARREAVVFDGTVPVRDPIAEAFGNEVAASTDPARERDIRAIMDIMRQL